MRGSTGEENEVRDGDKTVPKPCRPATRKESDYSTRYLVTSSPWTSLLEVAPSIYQHEKALLVMREHDYAKASNDSPLLHFVANCQSPQQDNDTSSINPDHVGKQYPNQRTVKDMLLNCRRDLLNTRQQLARKDSSSVTEHLRELVALQVMLIHEQQEQLYGKDKELASVRKEKEQLQARLERMERRLSILHRRDKDKLDEDEPENPIPGTPHSAKLSHGKQESAPNSSEAQEESCTSSAEGRRAQLAPTAGSHHICATPSQQSKKSAKRRLKTDSDEVREGKPAKRKVQKPTHVRTSADYCGLGLVVPHPPAADAGLCEDGEKEEEAIAVPCWHPCSTLPVVAPDVSAMEDTSDDAIGRRHKKLEEDEKRRKRWDLQRSRRLKEHQDLLQKYLLKSGGGGGQVKEKKEKITTFEPKLEQLEGIEVMETIAVNAFGRPVPLLEPSEFELPCLSSDAKDTKESTRSTRSKSKLRPSGGSTDEA
eukprot:Em0004g94a